MTAASAVSSPTSGGRSLAGDSGRAIVGAIVSNVCNVLVILVIARALGSGAVGEYTIAFAIRAILLLVCGVGMRTAMTRFVAAHLAREEHDRARGAVMAGVAVPTAFAIVVAVAWFLLAGTLAAEVFHEPALELPLKIFAASLPYFVFTDVALSATQGFRTMRPYVWVGQVLEPAGRLTLTVVVLVAGGGIVGASYALLVASAVSAVAAGWSLWRMLGRVPGSGYRTDWRELTSFGALSWLASMATQGLLWADIVILGVFVSAAEVGAYQVAVRVVLIGMFVITPLTAAMAPRIAHHWARHDAAEVANAYTSVVLWSARLSLPVLAGLVAARGPVLEVFGTTFPEAAPVVLILAAGAFVESFGAPSAVVINQIGRNGVNVVINVSALALNLGLNVLLIPLWGIEGAAAAWAVTILLSATARVVVVHVLDVAPWPWGRRLAVAMLGALIAGECAVVAVTLLRGHLVLELAVAAVVVLLVHIGIVVFLGLSRAERQALSRQVSTRLPVVRRWREQHRLRDAEAGADPLPILELISPFRADVLARLDLFYAARDHQDLYRDKPDAFIDLAWAGPYGGWFREVVVARGHLSDTSPAALRRTFHAIVVDAMRISERYYQSGRSVGAVTITRLPAGVDLDGWYLEEDRWVLLDGGHRVALALFDGRDTLSPDEYVVVDWDPEHPPPNNSRLMLTSGVLPPEVVKGLIDQAGVQVHTSS